MPRNVYLPQWGMGMSDATIIKWLVNEGDPVKKGDHLVEVESSKVNAEIESPAEGKIGKIKSQEGEVVKVGEVVAIIVGEGEKLVDSDEADKSISDSEKKDLKVNKQASVSDASQITPRARKLAKDLDLDISLIKGTGPNDRITDEDVRTFNLENSGRNETTENITGIRKIIAKRMSQSNQIPSVTLVSKVILENVNKYQESLISLWRKERIRPTFQDILIKCVSKALEKNEMLNSHYMDGEIKTFQNINIGFAYASKKGLVVPVVKNTEKKSIIEIAKMIREYSKIEKSGFKPEHFSEGTFSITNLSSSVVDYFDPLINPPQVGILGIGRISSEVFIDDGEMKERKACNLSFTFDHRVIDGYPAAKFLEEIVKNINNPASIDD